ncbi:hypothetical protein F2Q70_00023262 [Brassica cretica]|uniref:Uncharacterized protein n=1 Tax=Brassica cretica TaxID=69181 RepID=A0A8S9GSK7_BRACR|nr:hypothetical protein F2Q70_00023262 [Brassica cretica]
MEPSDTVQSGQTQVQETQTAEPGVDSAGNRHRESQVEETESSDGCTEES